MDAAAPPDRVPAMPSDAVDWPALRHRAAVVAERARAPYSGLRVGAAALTDDGTVVSGCNVESASFGLSLCAECGVISQAAAAGPGAILAISVIGLGRGPLVPCGRCRQLLMEHGGPEMLVDTPTGPTALSELLPQPFRLEPSPGPGHG